MKGNPAYDAIRPHITDHRIDPSTGRLQVRTRLQGGSDWSRWLDGDYRVGAKTCACDYRKALSR
jgi:hypothetical protein